MRRLRVMLLAGLMAIAVSGIAPVSVHAGSNGNQVELVDDMGTVFSACADGTNQNGTHVRKCWPTPATYNPLANYWWVGWVLVDEYNSSGGYIGTVAVYVDRVAPAGHNYKCFYSSGSGTWWC